MQSPRRELPDIAAELLDRVRRRAPRVHCITNAVAQAFTANMLLAAGSIPSMTLAAGEVAAFAARADALLVNLGTFDPERRKASVLAIAAARKAGRPWVLDPVFVDRSPKRAQFARTLAARKPAALRLNAAEFQALSGMRESRRAVSDYARSTGATVGLTGQVDTISDGRRFAAVGNGDPLMARVTAMGCAGSALTAAFLAVEDDAFLATASALAVFGVAGELAARRARGPGSFAVEMLDAIHAVGPADVIRRAKVRT